jgi:acyl carrier protein
MTTQNEIEQFILNELLSGSRDNIPPEEELFKSGALDSLATLRMITFIEERFGLQVGDGEVGDENFGTISRLSAFVDRKRVQVGF